MANRGRARSADRAGQQEELFGQLIGVLRDLRMERPVERREMFKPPQFNGEGDVELFIQHYTEVAAANQWNDMAALLHLREALQEGAQEYGRAGDIEGIFTALRSRYGLTTKEARSRLNNLKRDHRRSLHDHAVDVERLVRKAFAELPDETQASMMLDSFCSSLCNAALQRHLLAIQPDTLTAAVQHGNEFLQIKQDRVSADSAKVRAMENSEASEDIDDDSEDPLAKLMKSIQLLTTKVEQLEKKATEKAVQPPPPKEKKCWGCQQTGHTRKVCKTHPWPKNQTGNGDSPQ